MDSMKQAARSEGQVQMQLEALEKAMHAMADTVEQIEQRLTTVLLPAAPGEDVGEDRQELVPLAGFLRDQVQFLSSHTSRLGTVLARIEL